MLILNQKKTMTTESMALSIENIENSDNKKQIMVQENCGKLYCLGIYDTEERAKEVLQEIIEKYKEENYAMIESMAKAQLVYEMPEK